MRVRQLRSENSFFEDETKADKRKTAAGVEEKN